MMTILSNKQSKETFSIATGRPDTILCRHVSDISMGFGDLKKLSISQVKQHHDFISRDHKVRHEVGLPNSLPHARVTLNYSKVKRARDNLETEKALSDLGIDVIDSEDVCDRSSKQVMEAFL